jgi:hypothetical protein
MRLFFAAYTLLFAIASYQVLTDESQQPIVAAAIGGGLVWFAFSTIRGE